MKSFKKSFLTVFIVLSTLFTIWLIISYFNVISGNMHHETAEMIWDWNFFKVFFG